MAVRPSPYQYHCPACGWSKTVAPLSDALGPGDFYSACPLCKHTPLNSRPADVMPGKLVELANTIERLWKSLR